MDKALLSPTEQLQGHIGLLENYIDTLVPALILRGESITTNLAALAMQSEAFRNNTDLYPSALLLQKLQSDRDGLGVQNILLRNRIINTLVELHESQ